MNQKFFDILSVLILLAGIFIWGKWIIDTHPKGAIVSWDEGFHAGGALFITAGLKNNFAFQDYTYILNDFKNGIIWYLPLWWSFAGLMGAIFKPSVEIYRLTTLIFSILSIILIYLFAKSVSDIKGGFISAVTLATIPIFIVYSHLMMIEIPLLFSSSLALLFFYRYLIKDNVTRFDFYLTLIAFIIGVSTKITAIAIIFGVILVFGVFLKLFFKELSITKRFYSRQTIFFLLSAFLAFSLFRQLERKLLNADLVDFYLGQAKQLTDGQNNFVMVIVKTLINNLTFYLKDLSHMLPLAVIWLGSTLAYILTKRSILACFLFSWIFATYLIFSAVKPQAVQYILPIFVPISLAVGLFWSEFINYRNKKIHNIIFIIIILSIAWVTSLYFKSTETIGWRNTITYQEEAAFLVAQQARSGERVITTGDGTRFLVRLLGFDKKIQTINGAAINCPEFIQDSVEWAISDNGPQSPVRLNELHKLNWNPIIELSGSLEKTTILKNSNQTNEINLTNIDPKGKKCIRFLLPGKNIITIFAKSNILSNYSSGTLKIDLKINAIKTLKSLTINEDELRQKNGTEQKYSIIINQTKTNQPVYLSFDIPKYLILNINRITIQNEN